MRVVAAAAMALGVTTLLPSCGSGFDYDGQAGVSTRIYLDSNVPVAFVSVDDSPLEAFILDTGSPVTLAETSNLGFPTPGVYTSTTIDAFGLHFTDRPVLAANLFAASSQQVEGLLGADILRHFAFTVDYKGLHAWLGDPFVAPTGVVTGPEVDLAFELHGGGAVSFPGCACSERIGATRVLVQVGFETHAPVYAVVDTGASYVVIDEALLGELGTPVGPRPMLALTIATPTSSVDGYYSRVYRAQVSGFDGKGMVEVDDVPVVVESASDLFASISSETGVPVRALIGSGYLRWFLTTIDYQAATLRLARYDDESHIDPNEFVGVGFDVAPSGGGWTIEDVFTGTDAAAQGLVPGEIVDKVGPISIGGLSGDLVQSAFDVYHLGDRIPIAVRASEGATDVTYMILVEDLLPHYLPPT